MTYLKFQLLFSDGAKQETEQGTTSNQDYENDQESEFEKAEVIFNILLNKPEDFELKTKPSVERNNNFMCTLDMNKVTLASARADDNGAYSRRGSTRKHYYVHDERAKVAHKLVDGCYFINVRDNSTASHYPVYIKEYVAYDQVYLLQRPYRYSKSNNFYNMIAVINKVTSKQPHNFYLYLNRWMDSSESEESEP